MVGFIGGGHGARAGGGRCSPGRWRCSSPASASQHARWHARTSCCCSAYVFCVLGLLAGVWAEKFEQINFFPTFVMLPLTFLGGVFYSVRELPEPCRTISLFNPMVYMVEGLRYGMLGTEQLLARARRRHPPGRWPWWPPAWPMARLRSGYKTEGLSAPCPAAPPAAECQASLLAGDIQTDFHDRETPEYRRRVKWPSPSGSTSCLRKIASGGMGQVFLAREQGRARAAGGAQAHPSAPGRGRGVPRPCSWTRRGSWRGSSTPTSSPSSTCRRSKAGTAWPWSTCRARTCGGWTSGPGAQGRPLPLGLVLRIIADAAAGLDYAHKARDAQGQPLRLVHRDVSPQNILVGFDGGGEDHRLRRGEGGRQRPAHGHRRAQGQVPVHVPGAGRRAADGRRAATCSRWAW